MSLLPGIPVRTLLCLDIVLYPGGLLCKCKYLLVATGANTLGQGFQPGQEGHFDVDDSLLQADLCTVE